MNGTHPDLRGHTVAGYNAITKADIAAGAASDDNGHGSMVSGIVAAGTGNGEGIAGVAWSAEVMPVKVLDSNGEGADSDVVDGINWAVAHGAKILNLSLGGDADSPVLHDAVSSAVANGAVVVVAAGNSGDDVPEYPAAYPEAVAVAATDTDGALTDFSSYGSWVDVAAPGFDILSTEIADSSGNDNYAYGDGTSFSAPIVSGVVTLLRAQTPTLTPAQVLARLRSTARDAGPRGIDPYFGAGIVDATNAVGGGWAPSFGLPGLGAGEPNDVPSRATPLTGTMAGTIGVEGDADWYRVDSTTTQPLSVTVTPPAWDTNVAQNSDPVVSVYDSNLRPLAVTDHHGIGDPELVGWTAAPGASYVEVQNVNGARDPRPYTVSLARHPGALLDSPSWLEQATPTAGSTAVADVTGDGRADVVTVLGDYGDPVTPRGIIVYAQTAAGQLDEGTFYPTANDSPVMRLSSGDVDGDGAAEVLSGTYDGVQVFHRLPDGTLAAPQYLSGTSGSQVEEIATGDLDGDGHPDVAVTLNGSPYIRIHQADGSYATAAHFQISMSDLSIADLDGDGRPEVLGTSGGNVVVLRADPTGWRITTHPVSSSPPAGSGVSAARNVDVNRDGRPDVVALVRSNDGPPMLATYLQAADGTLQAPTTTPLPSHSETLAVADVNGDGIPDLVTSGTGYAAMVSVLPGLAGGGFGEPASTGLGESLFPTRQGELSIGDLDGDGHPDVALMTRSGIAVLRNATTATPPGPDGLWVQGSTPSDVAWGVAPAAAPTVTFARDVTASTVTGSTISLLDGRTGSDVPASVTYDAGTRTATVAPTSRLENDAPYRLTVSGVTDASGATMGTAYSSTFQTVDPASLNGRLVHGHRRRSGCDAVVAGLSVARREPLHRPDGRRHDAPRGHHERHRRLLRLAHRRHRPQPRPGHHLQLQDLGPGPLRHARPGLIAHAGGDRPDDVGHRRVSDLRRRRDPEQQADASGQWRRPGRHPRPALLAQGRHHDVVPPDGAHDELHRDCVLRQPARGVARLPVGLPRVGQLRRVEQCRGACRGPDHGHRRRQPDLAAARRLVHDLGVGRADARRTGRLPPAVCRQRRLDERGQQDVELGERLRVLVQAGMARHLHLPDVQAGRRGPPGLLQPQPCRQGLLTKGAEGVHLTFE